MVFIVVEGSKLGVLTRPAKENPVQKPLCPFEFAKFHARNRLIKVV